MQRADGSETASGQWRNGKLHGRGRQTLPGGHRYEGDFVDGKYSGLGSSVQSGGKAACGEWAGGKMSGFGMQWNRNGSLAQCGRWINDRLVQSCSVPRSRIPFTKFLSPAGQPLRHRRRRR